MKLEIEDTELIALLINLKDRLTELEKKLDRPPIIVKEYVPYPVVERVPYWNPAPSYPWVTYYNNTTTTGTLASNTDNNTFMINA